MSRLYHQSVRVTLNQGMPSGLYWRGKLRRVRRIHNHWLVRQGWHREETHRSYYRVETEGYGVYDVYQELANGQWVLERVYD